MVNADPASADRIEADWTDFERELEAWGGSGQVATLWWRDDDAVRVTPALARLLGCAGETPLALAVIPGTMRDDDGTALARRLDHHPDVTEIGRASCRERV